MECHLELKQGSNHQQLLGKSEKKVLSQARQRLNPQDKFTDDRRSLSYADMHNEITKSVDDLYPKHLENRLKQRIGRKVPGEEDRVKYKSYVPGYLKKGENLQKKVSDVGVLDSGNLEKRQYGSKQIKDNSTRASMSSINTSSSLFTDESSADSSKDYNHSPSHKTASHHPLKFYLMPPHAGHSQVFKPCGERSSKLKDDCFSQNPSSISFQQHEKKDSDIRIDLRSETLHSGMKCKVAHCIKSQDDDFKKRGDKLGERNLGASFQDLHGKEKTAAFFVPRIVSQKTHLGVSKFSDSTMLLAKRVAENSWKSSPGRSKEVQRVELNSTIPLSSLFRREVDGDRHSQLKRISVMDTEKNKFSSERSRSAPRSTKTDSSPSRGRKLEEKKSTLIFTRNEPLIGSDMKSIKVPSDRARSISPFRRLSFSIGKTSKSSNTKDGQTLPHLSTTNISSTPRLENPVSSCNDSSCCDKGNATSRGRSSPLRRLLEPLMKPKSSNSCKFTEPSQKGLTLSHGKHIILEGHPCSSTLQSVEGKSSTVQALLHVTVKNSQPMFTFAVDKEHNITTATVKKQTTPEKDECGYIYTFFAVQEVTKKNAGWINQGGKNRCQEYTSNVVAQMRVSNSKPSSSTRGTCMDQCVCREFVLFASDSLPRNELAAIAIKIPRRVNRSLARDLCQSEKHDDMPEIRFKECINATVVLPSGIHSLPHKGGPSSLIQRWKSGGSCDCGGWDMGCNLRILTNQHLLSQVSTSSEASSISDQFQLFFQGGQQDNRPFFCFTPYKEGIFAVEYNSSLSLLQAFFICIAICDSRKLCELSELSGGLHEDKPSGETALVQSDRLKPSALLEGEVPARYVSYPPLSPVGRA